MAKDAVGFLNPTDQSLEALGARFILDDDPKTQIHCAVIVKNIHDMLIGAEFADSQVFDLEPCSYLALS